MPKPKKSAAPVPPGGQFLVYQTEDGLSRVECRFLGETLWLSLNKIAALFDRDKSVISKHLKNVFADEELDPAATVAKHATVQTEGSRQISRDIEYYNLEAIFAVGYRVRSPRGIQFRTWATARLKEFLVKGFTMDDERLKHPGSSRYFEQLLARIRDIRTSEKVFWRKICDIYATSIDYDGKAETSQRFFAHVQNKMHWATHGHTAAEIIHQRADAAKPHMGLTHFAGLEPRRDEAAIAKNYLSEGELEGLNRLVNAYLEFAELQARRGRLMKMIDRNELEDQMLKNLASVGLGNVAHAHSIAELNRLLDQQGQDYRGIIVTMIHKFRDMPAA